MKLRIRGNTLRLRLTQSEVAQVARGETVLERSALSADSEFTYSLGAADSDVAVAALEGDHLAIHAPKSALLQWASTDEVAVDCASDPAGSDILIEKDFACLSPRTGEDDSDTYPHPKEGRESC